MKERLEGYTINSQMEKKTVKTEINKELNELKKSIHRYFKDTE